MKKMRKIIPALAMLLVSAVMMSTASFAWFSMNTTATIEGMQVKATSSGGLAIAVSNTKNVAPPDGSVYKTSVDVTDGWTNNASQIQPVSNTAGSDSWYYGRAASVDSFAIPTTGEGSTYTSIGTIAPDGSGANEGNGYFLHTQVFVKSLSEAHVLADGTNPKNTGSLYVSKITVAGGNTTGAGKDLEKALRVAVRYTDNKNTADTADDEVKWLYFAPKATAAATDLKYVNSTTTTTAYTGAQMFIGEAATESTDANTIKTFANAQIFAGGTATGLLYDTPVKIDIFVYYEGEDTNCKTQNAIDLKTLTVTVDFTIK